MEVFKEVDRSEARLRYDILMERHPPMTHNEIEEQVTSEGLALETAQRVKSRSVVVNSISDSMCFALLVAGVLVNRKRVKLIRQGVYKKYLRLPPSAQAIGFLLVTDILVGYHSSDGWITFVEVFLNRYTISGAEDNEARSAREVEETYLFFLVSHGGWEGGSRVAASLSRACVMRAGSDRPGWRLLPPAAPSCLSPLLPLIPVPPASSPPQKLISLFVAVVPVVADVAFKFWVYKYLRKLSPGTQIIMAEME